MSVHARGSVSSAPEAVRFTATFTPSVLMALLKGGRERKRTVSALSGQ